MNFTREDSQNLRRMVREIQRGVDEAERAMPAVTLPGVAQKAFTAARADAAWLLALCERLDATAPVTPVITQVVDGHLIHATRIVDANPLRWCVVCRSCETLVHASTPTPDAQIHRHVVQCASARMTWQTAARGIPLWPECRAAGTLVPDLEDPDTRVAYIRRLAVALGCPLPLAAGGVIVDWSGSSRGIVLCAGIPRTEWPDDADPFLAYPWEADVLRDNALMRTPENLTLALALAWPVEART